MSCDDNRVSLILFSLASFSAAQDSAPVRPAAALSAESTTATATVGAAPRNNSQPAAGAVGARVEAWLLASKWRWQELLDAVDAAGDGAGEYLRQADQGGYTALHRSISWGVISWGVEEGGREKCTACG